MYMNEIMIIDEDIRALSMVRSLKLFYNINVSHFADPQEGIRSIKEGSYKVLLLDIMIPWKEEFEELKCPSIEVDYGNLTGLHILYYLRKVLELDSQKLKIVMVSARSEAHIKGYVKDDFKYDKYLQKSSFGHTELYDTINKLLNEI